jgi:hypothetical protein
MLQLITAALFAIVIGAAFTMWGYRIFLVLLPIWGFFAGLWFGAHATTILFGGSFLATTTGLVIGFVLGLILAVLSYLFYMIGVAIVAGAIGYALGAGLMAAFGFDSNFLIILVGVIGGALALVLTLMWNLQKYVIIILTAIAGANALVLGVLLLFNQVSLESVQSAGSAILPVIQASWLWAIVWLVVAIVGIVYQIRINRAYTYDENTYYIESWG